MEVMRYKKIQQVQLIVILLNILTSVSKLIIGIVINSVSMTADGIHSMADGLNNVVGMIGVYFAFQPIDERHPYGHRKFETMTTLFIGALLIATSISLLKGAYIRIMNPIIPTVTPISFMVMIFSIMVNICVTTFEKKKGIVLDPKDISNVVCEFKEVHSSHKIRSRGCLDDIHLDLHVVASYDMTLEDSHQLIHDIDNLLKSRFPGVTDVTVHVDPPDYYKKIS